MRTSTDTVDVPLADDPEARTARTVLVLFVVGLIVALVGGGVFVVAERRHDRRTAPGASDALKPGNGAVTALGPVRGAAVDPYISARNQALAQARGTRLAVVSFTRYASDAEARRAVGGVQVVSLLVAAPGGQPDVVTGNLGKWAGDARQEALRQRAEIQRLLDSGTVDDPDYLSFYRSEVARYTRVAQSVDPAQPLVFALLVSGPAAELQSLAKAPGVRLVDVGASDKAAPGAAFTGLRPEETTTAGTPPTRP